MAETREEVKGAGDLRERLESLQQFQHATMNLLEDFDEERRKFQLIQKATLNLLEDMNEEKNKFDLTQRALMNMLEDIEVERARSEHAKALLESANKELESFSYSVSHDLQAPLRAISGFAEAVEEDYAPRIDEEGRRYLQIIKESSHKMMRLIDDLLSFSRLGRQQMTEADIDMEALAKEVFNELLTQASGRRVSFKIGECPAVRGDTAMMRQVLINLFANAIKFTRNKLDASIEFGYLPDLNKGAYYVKDNGVGFDMRYAGKLFGVFQRLHSVTEFEGTGVGLALVCRIITRHGGKVWAQGAVDSGAAFFFSLPKDSAQ